MLDSFVFDSTTGMGILKLFWGAYRIEQMLKCLNVAGVTRAVPVGEGECKPRMEKREESAGL